MGLLSSPLGFTLRDHFAGSADDPFRVATPGVNVSRHAADEGNGDGVTERRVGDDVIDTTLAAIRTPDGLVFGTDTSRAFLYAIEPRLSGDGEGGDEARITVDGRTLRSSPLAGHADDSIFDPVPPADYSPIG